MQVQKTASPDQGPSLEQAVYKNAPPRFHLLVKPSGSTCNLDCTYCFFLSKEALYPNQKSRMHEATTFPVTDAYRGMRLDRFLQQMLPRMSRARRRPPMLKVLIIGAP